VFINSFIEIELKKVNKRLIICVNNNLIIKMFAKIVVLLRELNY